MSEYDHDASSPPRHNSDVNLQNNLDGSANNSIIGKVKSTVTSILPNRFSKWFSPSAKLQSDSLNGSVCCAYNSLSTRRRRRIDVEEEENYEDDEDGQRCGEYEESNNMYPKQVQNRDRNVVIVDENDDDDDSQNSEEEYNSSSMKQPRRDLNEERQPPAKRSRLNIEVPIVTRHQPLLSSTPAVDSEYYRIASSMTPVPRCTYQRYTHLNLYGSQSKKEPAFNFGQQKESKSITKINTDIIDLVTNSNYEQKDKHNELCKVYGRTGIGSRKSLNIPSIATLTGAERVNATVAHLKRQPLSSAKADLPPTNMMGVPARRTSTTLDEVEHQLLASNEHTHYDGIENRDGIISDPKPNSYNGSIEGSNNLGTNKRQKLINGTVLNDKIVPESSEGILVDSASDSGESAMDIIKVNTSNKQQRKTGLFNMSAGGTANIRNSSRTSSFGNGLNFYSHLEGRKSLFGSSHYGNSNLLNNSTLSLTSLNRRQFNASIYGSTSALSDSRLLNTFSPFYKGKTTYGGAAAYNKYTTVAGASAVRITPTLIRPTSSLSTLSSSNTSLANNLNSHIGENSTISSTAKRILDLINDFATPLSEAKKMASNLKTNANLQALPRAKGRLNEIDLNASRAIRLSQVRTPYSRPAVILQPSGNASGRGTECGALPPVKELQVPTMSQLLQMKKMQSTTENARKISHNSVENFVISEYTLPDGTRTETNTQKLVEQDQQKHTNKIRNKVTNSLRPSVASKVLQDDKPPPPVNLPNIAFPLMESVPKIDIQIDKPLPPGKAKPDCRSTKLSTTESSNASNSTLCAFNLSPVNSLKQKLVSIADKTEQLPTTQPTLKSSYCFTFSEPLQIAGALPQFQGLTKNETDKHIFSPPLDVIMSPTSNCFRLHSTQQKQPQLKEGSCLDALSKPFSMPPLLPNPNATKTIPKKASLNLSTNEWECDACMIRNKSELNKCVACETPQKQDSLKFQQVLNSSVSASVTSFGLQFKKSSNEWECDTCMIRNKEELTKCAACETPRKREVPQSLVDVPAIKNSFGDAFKPKPDAWECQTCMISNRSELNECIACQAKKPGHTNITAASQSAFPEIQYKSDSATGCNKNYTTDAGFKTLAAQQKVSKWECDACMTRNDANRTKCACCEQPKPGTTSAESTNATSVKFQFGATAASKFSFGFGTGENAPKEEDLRKEVSGKSEESEKQPSKELGLCTSQAASELVGFQFGIKPLTSTTSECKKDDTDGNEQITEVKFGISALSPEQKISETSTVVPSLTGFDIGTNPFETTPTTSTPTSSSAAAANSSSVKFSLPSTTISTNESNIIPRDVALPAFGFGVSPASSTTGGFSFGNKIKTKTSGDAVEKNKASGDITFNAPAIITPTKTSGFVFGSSAVNNISTAVSTSFISSTANTTASTATTTTSTTTADIKPMFSYGINTLTTPVINSQTTPVFTSFSFGSNSPNNAPATTTANTSIAAVTSTSTITITTSATTKTSSLSSLPATTTTPASKNIFGSFGGSASSSNASSSIIFGSSVNPPANNNLSNVSSSTNNTILSNSSQFGAFGSKITSNVFGSFGGVDGTETKNSALVKPNGTKPTVSMFGNIAPSSTSQSSQSNSSGFVFGSNTAEDKTLVTTVSTVGSVTSTSTTWPKSSFVFGSKAATSSTNTAASVNTSENKEVAKPSVFGTFGSRVTNSNNQQQSPIFGVRVPAPNIGTVLSASGTTTSGPTNPSTNLFGVNSAPAATGIFGANSSGNAVTPASTFGSSPFGGATSSTNSTPTFGTTAASGTTFGSIGGSSSNTTSTTAVKKPETAFSFGAAPTTQNTSGGFNFGSSASSTKPAFNFGGTSTTQQPTFNFSGSTEPQSSTKLFQFGATPSAPVFSFNRGVLEAGTNTRNPDSTTGKTENSCTDKASNTTVETTVILNAFDSVDRSQQNKHKQTGLCLRQKINSSRINKKDLKHQCQNLQQQDDPFFSKILNNETDDVTSCSGKNTANVASNKKQLKIRLSNDLSNKMQNDANNSLIQKNKILLNKYKLVRRTLSTPTSAAYVDNALFNKRKEGKSNKIIVNSSNGGQETAKRIVKLKPSLSPAKKIRPIKQISSTNCYRKINYVIIKKSNEENR